VYVAYSLLHSLDVESPIESETPASVHFAAAYAHIEYVLNAAPHVASS
jgi:hypothetical protein